MQICKFKTNWMNLSPDHIQQISARLSIIFEESGLTQQAIAKDIGIDQGRISGFLAGKFKRNSKNLKKLCKYAEMLAKQNNLSTEGLHVGGEQLELPLTVERLLDRNTQIAGELEDIASRLRRLKAEGTRSVESP
jgi:transcriptional regulator with XRE-family HTH domain